MSTAPENLHYIATHQWLRLEEGGTGVIGITDFAQDELGDVVFVEMPEVGKRVKAGDELGIVESVKTASDIFSPVSGTILDVNTKLDASPEVINESPYEAGWICRIELSDMGEVEGLLSAEAYLSGC